MDALLLDLFQSLLHVECINIKTIYYDTVYALFQAKMDCGYIMVALCQGKLNSKKVIVLLTTQLYQHITATSVKCQPNCYRILPFIFDESWHLSPHQWTKKQCN